MNKGKRQKAKGKGQKVKIAEQCTWRGQKLLYFCLLIFVFCLFTLNAPAVPIESAIHVTLDNGLQVILMENHANPLIASSVIVKAGVRNETPDINGVSHLLEHLLFNGTKTRTQRQLYDEVDYYGAYNNASTSRDYTLFQMLVRKEYISQILNIQADMLFNSILPEENLEKERNIVIEEIRKDQSNFAYLVENFFNAKLYQGTSYAMPVLGTPELISTIPREKILAYYHQFYRPDNMILVLMGDFETKDILEIVHREFGIPVDRSSGSYQKPVFSQKAGSSIYPDLKIKERKLYSKGLDSSQTYLSIALNAPHILDPDFYAFSMLTSILNSDYHPGFSFKDLEALGVQDLQVNLNFNDQFSFLVISATLPASSDTEQVLQQILTKLDQLKAWPVSSEAIEKVMVKLEAEEVFQSEQFHYYTFYKAPYLAAVPFEWVRTYLKTLQSVTPEVIQRVVDKYFMDPPVLATLLRPGQEEEERGGVGGWGSMGVRECQPLFPHSPILSLKREVLDNGLTVIIKENPDTEVFAFHLLAKHRKALEPEGKSGIAEFLHRMLLRGTRYRNVEDISDDLRSIGANLKVTDDRSIPYDDYYFSPEYSYLRFETPVKYAYQGFIQLADLIKNPEFDPDQVENIRAQLLNDIQEDKRSPRVQARNLFYKTLFVDHPLAQPILGKEQEIKLITAEDLKEFHQTYFAPNNLIISVVSSLPAEKVLNWLRFYFAEMPSLYSEGRKQEDGGMGKWEKRKVEIKREKRIVEQEMGRPQSYIYLGNLFQFKEADEVALVMMNALLSDRITFNLREKQGLAYAIGSSVFLSEDIGWFQISMGTGPENLPQAQEELVTEIKKFQTEEVSPDKLERTVNRLLGSLLMRRMTSINQAYFLGLQEFRNKPLDADDQFIKLAQKLTPPDIQRVANAYLDPERYVMVTVK